jgi:Carboxypeptidase regulatory-like domain
MRTSAFVVAVALVCSIGAVVRAQQGTASVAGKVTDAQGGLLPGVNIIVTNEESGVYREVVTGAEGSYAVSQIIPGRYRMSATLEGFKTLDRRGVTLTVGQTTTLNLQMEVGGLAETLTVTGEAPLVDVSSATVGGHISAEELNDLPSANRNYMAFVGNVPGTIFLPSAGFLNDTFQANGQPSSANNIVFDGANNTDEQRGSNVGGQTRAANESIAEVQVITNSFDAEWGRASGAVVNAVTKSGTNNLTGSAFAFFTGKGVTEKDFFTKVNNAEKPDVGKQEWGFTLGGPIVRNKLHYFVSLERLVLQRNWAKSYPNRPDLSFSTNGDEAAWNTLWRIDHQINSKHTWAFRWLREIAPQFKQIDGGQETPSSHNDETDLDQTLVGTLTSVVSDTKVNTFRLGGVLEETVHSNPAWRALKPEYANCVPCPDGAGIDQNTAAPVLDYDSFDLQAHATMDYSLQYSYSIDDTFSWFIPDAKGRHDMKFGARFTRTDLDNPNWSNMNGTYSFDHDLVFDAANPFTYPNRFSMRVPGPLSYALRMDVLELYGQDKWQIRPNLTLSAGVRYDLEKMPYTIDAANPFFSDPNKYPVDKDNVAPRIGLIWNPDGGGKSVVRMGYGLFYDRTQLGNVDNFLTDTKYAQSFTAQFPQNTSDPGPAAGRLPTDPTLTSGRVDQITPAVRAYVESIYPPGTTTRNTGTIYWDDPEREQPYFQQLSVGYEREVLPGVSLQADYISMRGKDMFLAPDLNIGTRINTTRSGRIDRTDPFGVLAGTLLAGEPMYAGSIRLRTTKYGYSNYDALNLSMEKRYSNNYSLRAAYTIGYSRGVASGQGDNPDLQEGTDLHLDEWFATSGSDRKHNLVLSGRMEIPKTRGVTLSGMLRALSGSPFTIQDTSCDCNRNGGFFEPLPDGTYNPFPDAGEHVRTDVKSEGGRNGARGPGFVQLDMRIGYRARLGGRRTVDVFGEVFNVTNRVNFTNPNGDMRVRANFLRYAGLSGTTGFPRQMQLGLRFGF